MDFPWPLDTINADAIKAIVDDGWLEGQNLEFKSDEYPRTDSGIKEMLRDIASMANGGGGYIFLGIAEDDSGRACAIMGVQNAERECQRVNQSCLDSIIERIPQLSSKSVEVEPGLEIVVIYVPTSTYRPHMICKEGRTEFWKRYDRDKRRMQYEEIRRDFTDYSYQQQISRIETQIGELRRDYTVPNYAILETENPEEKFLVKFMHSENITNLIIVSPFISLVEGSRVSLRQICDQIEAKKIPTFVITTEPSSEQHSQALDLLRENQYTELRFNKYLHAKLFIAMSQELPSSFAMFGSGNLTSAAVSRNIEIGMLIFGKGHGRSIVQSLYRWSSTTLRTMADTQVVKKRTVARRN